MAKEELNMETFNDTFTPGNVKTAMEGSKSSDLWKVKRENLRISKGFNVRNHDSAAHAAHVRSLADSLKTEGWIPASTLAGYVAVENGEQVIIVTDGHCRLEAFDLAVSEGAELSDVLPLVAARKGTSMEDLTVALVRSNSGKPLEPYELGVVCKRLVNFGWEHSQIASRLGLSEKYVDDLLSLMAAPKALREMVLQDKVAAGVVIEAIRKKGAEGAMTMLTEGLQKAGGERVTARHLPEAKLKKAMTRLAPKMYSALKQVHESKAWDKLDIEVRNAILEVLDGTDFAGGVE